VHRIQGTVCGIGEAAVGRIISSGTPAQRADLVGYLLLASRNLRGGSHRVVPPILRLARQHFTIDVVDIRDNLIDYCPVELVDVPNVLLDGNPLPPQLLTVLERGGWPAARAYLRALAGGGGLAAPESVRLLLLGNEATGKTVLSSSLKREVSFFA
jgi:hypothetical protein